MTCGLNVSSMLCGFENISFSLAHRAVGSHMRVAEYKDTHNMRWQHAVLTKGKAVLDVRSNEQRKSENVMPYLNWFHARFNKYSISRAITE